MRGDKMRKQNKRIGWQDKTKREDKTRQHLKMRQNENNKTNERKYEKRFLRDTLNKENTNQEEKKKMMRQNKKRRVEIKRWEKIKRED